MLDRYPMVATIAVSDLERAKRFYKEKLGLEPVSEDPSLTKYRTGSSTFGIFEAPDARPTGHTVAGWEVDDIDKIVGELRSNGVAFLDYDLPDLKTVEGVADVGGERVAWFTDSEGNILCISQPRG
jgi:catechol 2,3-dioxygenase-like lactoylglutathione lyase family enzyme